MLGGFALSDAHADVIYQERSGVVVGEGEIYSSRTVTSMNDSWYIVPDENTGAGAITNARGGAYVQALPDQAGNGGGPLVAPSISYEMRIFTPGTYRLYLRKDGNKSDGNGGTSDSLFVDIVELKDGTNGVFNSSTNMIADWYESTGGVNGDFAVGGWTSTAQAEVNIAGVSGSNSDWLIPHVGVYSLRISQREDGAAIDSWVFQLKTLPAPTGDGPAISALEQSRIAVEPVEDTFVRRDETSTFHYTDTTVIVKNDSSVNPSALDRVTYLRFDISALSALEGMVLTNATLYIDQVAEGTTTNHDIYVAVIAEDAMAETFNETNLTASAAAPSYNDVWSGSTDEAVDFSKVYGNAPVGSFVIAASNNNKTVAFRCPGLLQAIRADTDGVLSLVLYRTADHPGGDTFASKESTSLKPPRLEVDFRARQDGTLITVQ